MSIEQFLSGKRRMSFTGAVLVALCSWGLGFAQWNDMFTPQAVFGLCGILGSLLLSNQTNNVFKTPPSRPDNQL